MTIPYEIKNKSSSENCWPNAEDFVKACKYVDARLEGISQWSMDIGHYFSVSICEFDQQFSICDYDIAKAKLIAIAQYFGTNGGWSWSERYIGEIRFYAESL